MSSQAQNGTSAQQRTPQPLTGGVPIRRPYRSPRGVKRLLRISFLLNHEEEADPQGGPHHGASAPQSGPYGALNANTNPDGASLAGNGPAAAASVVGPLETETEIETQAQTQPPAPSPKRKRARKYCDFPGCPRHFDRVSLLETHRRTHYRDERCVPCEVAGCEKIFFEAKHMREHVRNVHQEIRNFKCPKQGCGQAFLTVTHLRRHEQVHVNADAFRCRGHEPCAQSFRKRDTLLRHVRAEHLGLKPFVCVFGSQGVDAAGTPVGGCGETFDSSAKLKKHKLEAHDPSAATAADDHPPAFTCTKCEPQPVFRTLTELKTHQRDIHLRCQLCPMTVRFPAEMAHHVDLHHSGKTIEDRKTFQCAECPKTFTTARNCAAHVRTAHQGLRWVCGQVDVSGRGGALASFDWAREGCGTTFTTKSAVELHILHVHLKQPRRAPTPRVPAKNKAQGSDGDGDDDDDEEDLVDKLSGAAAAKKRVLQCDFADCGARFVRHHDLRSHVENHHVGGDQALGGEDEDGARVLGLVRVHGCGSAFFGQKVVPGQAFVRARRRTETRRTRSSGGF